MAKTTIILQGAARAVVCEALLEMLASEVQRIDETLIRADRIKHPKRTRRAWRRIHLVGRLLEKVGWGEPLAAGEIHIDAEDELPLVVAALREALQDARDIAEQVRSHGDGEAASRADARLHDTLETLMNVEAQGMRGREGRRE